MDEETKSFSQKLINTSAKKKNLNDYDSWKAAVHKSFPRVFFPNLKKDKITLLANICNVIRKEGIEPEKLMEWIVANWSNMPSLMGGMKYKIEYPELQLLMYDYAKFLNVYISRVAAPAPVRKKSTRTNIDDE